MKRFLKWIGLTILFVVSLAVILRLVIFDYVVAGGEDTWPSLGKGAWTVVNRKAEIRRGDLVLYQSPKAGYQIRRVIALPGEKISLTQDNRPIVSGGVALGDGKLEATHEEVRQVTARKRTYRVLRESFGGRSWLVLDDLQRRFDKPYAEKVSEGGYFVIGDNREHSYDSRTGGVVPRDKIRGVVLWQLTDGDLPWE